MGSNPVEHSWPSSTGQVRVTWSSNSADNNFQNGYTPNFGYQYNAQKEDTTVRDAQSANPAPQASNSSSVVTGNGSQDYSGYAAYAALSDPYSYNTADYQNYYYGYQQPASDTASHQVGANQNSGAPCQVLSSFQNSGSSVRPTSYSYYNPGDHQTVAYQSNGYNHQTDVWNDGSSGSYSYYPYPSQASSNTSSSNQSTTVAPASSQYYPHQYNQWSGYYSYTTPATAPRSENALATNDNTNRGNLQGITSGYPYPTSQPPPPGTTTWRGDNATYATRPEQEQAKGKAAGYNTSSGWQVGTPTNQPHQTNQVSSYYQKPLDSSSFSHKNEAPQNFMHSPGANLQLSSTDQVHETFQTPLQMAASGDHRVNKLQIPTNPRIAPTMGFPKADNSMATSNVTAKPAYISVSVPKPSDKVPKTDKTESDVKSSFPPSLRAYVERSFARCKNDAQRASNQKLMKEIMTRMSEDGTLLTKDWDVEPLFPLPDATLGMPEQSSITSSITTIMSRRSPSRRTKSRWEPVAEEKLAESPASANHELSKDIRWGHTKEHERLVHDKKSETSSGARSAMKFSSQQSSVDKTIQRPNKKQRFSSMFNTPESRDTSNDGDEQSLTKYYSNAIALADSPEEKKRRENRFKRFEKGHEHQGGGINTSNLKAGEAGSLYVPRANALSLFKGYDNGYNRAVEDIDWDSLTVKGTCQEIEKRYLRLTSAPDPASVRPEDVLEKALQMVQSSDKNYLYKCDQLKSIRQDLTVQRIQNELTVKVYETHARLALEAGDLPEYNQCQSQLKRLYEEGIHGSDMEFTAYSLLCVILHSHNKRDLLSSMTRLSAKAKEDEAVKHALAVRQAVSSGNYVLFFRLYKDAPYLSTCIMDLYVEKIRFEAVKCMSKSYRPTIPLSYISHVLGFSRRAAGDDYGGNGILRLEECEEWLRAHGAALTVDNNGELQLDAKVTSSTLYMPEPDDAVAHGDANLAVDDFLARSSA